MLFEILECVKRFDQRTMQVHSKGIGGEELRK